MSNSYVRKVVGVNLVWSKICKQSPKINK